MTRNDLKNIVKECLVEILSEGIGNSNKIQESKKAATVAPSKPQERSLQEMLKMKQNIANKTQYGNPAVKKPDPMAANNLVKSVTNDAVMAALFADTIETTLQEQVENDRRLLRGHSTDDDASSDLPVGGGGFSEEMSRHWSALAFNEVKKQK
jgi:hypothetical protein